MAACTKVAAFGALLRLFYVAFGGARWDWQPMIWIVAILTMVVGSVIAITQTDIKRMLAYSSIAHAGLPARPGSSGCTQVTGCAGTEITRLQAVLFYLVDLRVHDDRRVRGRHRGPRRRRRGDPPVALGRAGQGVAGPRRACSRSSCSRSPASR